MFLDGTGERRTFSNLIKQATTYKNAKLQTLLNATSDGTYATK